MIDILIPVLNRPQNAERVYASAHESCSVPVQILFLTTPGDPMEHDACVATGADVLEVPGQWHQYPSKMNAGFHHTSHPFLFLGADDIDFQRGWDSLALDAAEKSGRSVIGLDDMANAMVRKGVWSTHPLVRRSYIEEQGGCLEGPGQMLSCEYDHNYSERELCHLAQYRGQWLFVPSARVKHRHPAWGTAEQDTTYTKGFVRFKRDQQIFLRRAKGWSCVGLAPVERQRSACR